VEKKKELYVLPQLVKCLSTIPNFDLWMFKRTHDIFTLVLIFLDVNWQPKQVTIGLFETIETTRQALAINLNNLLDFFGLRKKIITFIKDERVNLNAMTSALKSIVSCDILGLKESFNGSCFRHFFPRDAKMGLLKRKFVKT
jgi:hypothetical protein